MANTFLLDIITAVGGEPRDYAVPGEAVVVSVRLKNLGGQGLYLAASGVWDSSQLTFSPSSAWAEYLQTIYFLSGFTMPSKDVKVIAYGWWLNGSQWVSDSWLEKDLLLAAAAPEFSDFRIAQYQKV
jgi:hypothetical protein